MFPLWAAPKAKAPEKFRLIHSDKLFLSKVGEEQILELLGNVHFYYGKTEFKSNQAMIFELQKIARLTGNVTVSNDTLSLSADSVAYYRTPEILNLGGKVLITEKKPSGSLRWFRSNNAAYNKKEDKLTAWGEVQSYDREENATLKCGYGFWDRKNGYAYLIEKPQLWTGKQDTLHVAADKMEFFDKERKLIATFNVKTESRDYQTSSDFLIYFLKEDKAVFTGEPSFNSEYATARAREFYLFFQDRKLQRAELRDSCVVMFAEERNAPQTNRVSAGFIEILFRDENISRFRAEDKVSYYYLQEKTEKKDYFMNEATGEYLEANFNKDNKLDFMNMKKSIRGTYKFHNNS